MIKKNSLYDKNDNFLKKDRNGAEKNSSAAGESGVFDHARLEGKGKNLSFVIKQHFPEAVQQLNPQKSDCHNCHEVVSDGAVEFVIHDSLLPKFKLIPLGPATCKAVYARAGKLSLFFENRECVVAAGSLSWVVILAVNDNPIGFVALPLRDRDALGDHFCDSLVDALELLAKRLKGQRPTKRQVLEFYKIIFCECALSSVGVVLGNSYTDKKKERELYRTKVEAICKQHSNCATG